MLIDVEDNQLVRWYEKIFFFGIYQKSLRNCKKQILVFLIFFLSSEFDRVTRLEKTSVTRCVSKETSDSKTAIDEIHTRDETTDVAALRMYSVLMRVYWNSNSK